MNATALRRADESSIQCRCAFADATCKVRIKPIQVSHSSPMPNLLANKLEPGIIEEFVPSGGSRGEDMVRNPIMINHIRWVYTPTKLRGKRNQLGKRPTKKIPIKKCAMKNFQFVISLGSFWRSLLDQLLVEEKVQAAAVGSPQHVSTSKLSALCLVVSPNGSLRNSFRRCHGRRKTKTPQKSWQVFAERVQAPSLR